MTPIKKFSVFPGKLCLLAPVLALISALSFGKALPSAVKNMSDQEYEDYIHSIYMKNYRDPVPYETWSRLIQSLPEKSHKLKKKDNLWDLSNSYLKDNFLWPKLWVANAHIDNPHRIRQGNSISFDRDTLAAVNRGGHSVNLREQFPDVKLPRHAYQKKALEEWEIPSSLPNIKNKIDPPPSDIGFDLGLAEMDKTALLPFYLSEEKLSGQGTVESKDGYGSAAFNGEDIMISYDGEIVIDGLYTVFENRGPPVFSFVSLLGLNFKGYEIAVKAIVKIIGFVEGSEGLYRARIMESLAPVTSGHKVMKGVSGYTLSQKGSPGSVSGKIIGSPHWEIETYLGIYSLVYLDKGLSNGIQVGDVYDVRLNEKARTFQYPYLYERPAVGKLRVIHANPDTATAIIIAVRDTVKIGDFFEPKSGVTVMKDSMEHEEISEEENITDPHEEMGMELIEEPEEKPAPETEPFSSDESEAEPPSGESASPDEMEARPSSGQSAPPDGMEAEPPSGESAPPDGMEAEPSSGESASPDGMEVRPSSGESASPDGMEAEPPSGESASPDGMEVRPVEEFDETELNQPDPKRKTRRAKKPNDDSTSPVPEEVKQEFMEIDEF